MNFGVLHAVTTAQPHPTAWLTAIAGIPLRLSFWEQQTHVVKSLPPFAELNILLSNAQRIHAKCLNDDDSFVEEEQAKRKIHAYISEFTEDASPSLCPKLHLGLVSESAQF
eukprot:12050415-Karenia_brevis.AAC.1